MRHSIKMYTEVSFCGTNPIKIAVLIYRFFSPDFFFLSTLANLMIKKVYDFQGC